MAIVNLIPSEGNLQAKTGITPSTSSQTITADNGYNGLKSVQINGDADLTAANIKKGVGIFGVTGTFTTTPSGKTAMTSASLRSGYAGFINGSQVNGSMADTTVTEGTTTVSSGTATRGTWSQTAGYTVARTIDPATFANTATADTTYVDISATEEAPVLVAGDSLYINKGYTDNLKISLAKLVPDGSDVKGHGDYLLSGHSAYDNDGTLVAGTIQSMAGGTKYATTSNQTISTSGKYLTSNIVINKLSSTNYSAANIKDGTTISVSNGSSNVFSVAGTFTDASTVSSGQTAATASQMLNGYSAWVDGAEVKGTIATKTSSDLSASGKTVTVPAGYYASQCTRDVDTATPAFDGGTLSGGSTATFSNITTQVADNGIKIQTKYTGASTAVLYNGAVDGYVNVADNTQALAAKTLASTNGTAYYIAGVTVPASQSFSVTASGTSSFSAASATAGTLLVNAYNSSGTSEGGKTIVSNGKWSAVNVSNSGTYYGRVTVGSGAYSASVVTHSVTTTPAVTGATSGTVTNISSTTKPSGTDGTNYWTITPGGSVTTTGVSTAKGKATIGTAGYISTGSAESTASTVNITPSVSNGTARYISKATSSILNGTASATANAGTASISKNPSASASATAYGMDGGYYTDSTTSSYYVDCSASAASGYSTATGGSASASVTASSATVGVGYNPSAVTASTTASSTGTKTGNTATSTEVTSSTSQKIYLKPAAIAGSSTNATATTTVAPGTVSISKQSTPSGVTNAASGNATTTAPTSGVYVAVKATAAANTTGTTSSISGSGSATVSSAGYAPTTLTGTVSVSGTATAKTSAKDSSMTYVPITTATPAFDGGTLSGGSTATGTNVTLSTTDNGMKVQTAYTAASTAVLYNGAVNGWVTKSDNAQALAAQSKGSTNGTAYYVTAVTMPKDKGFSVTTTADTALDTTSDLDVTNNAYRRVDITNKANGSVIVANSGTTNVTSGSATAGSLTVSAYNSSGTAENDKSIVSNGKWVATSVSTTGTYYGRVTVGSATPAFDGGTLSGGSTATFEHMATSSTNNGIKVQTAYTAASTAVLYNGAVNGWVTKADNAQALAAKSKSSTNGTAYYVTALSVPKDVTFTISTDDDTALDTTSDLVIYNGAYRGFNLTNYGFGAVTNQGQVNVQSSSSTTGTLSVSAYNSGDTLESNIPVVSNGKWVDTDVTAPGTYYGRVDVPSTSLAITVTATSSTSKTINNSEITANHYVYNTVSTKKSQDISWTTSEGSITLTCSEGIPAMTLLLCRDF